MPDHPDPHPKLTEQGHNIVVKEENISAQPPADLGKLRLGAPYRRGAGVPAILSTLRHAGKYMSPQATVKTMFKVNQKGGFDCPGCAWPDPDDERSSLGEFCENGFKAIAEEAQKKRLEPDFFARHSVSEMSQWSDYKLGKRGRLAHPMVLKAGATHYQAIGWEDAFALIGSHLRDLASPDEAIFYTSGRTSNEAAFLYQLFVREYGTNNLPDCSNMCHESTSVALAKTIGIGKGTVTLEDLYQAEVIMIIGQNPGTNHPRMLSALEKCKRNGGKIIAVNPLPETGLMNFVDPQSPRRILTRGVDLCDLFLQVNVNGDVALLKAIMQLLWYEEQKNLGNVFDMDFIVNKTEGYEAFLDDLKKQDFNQLAEASGVPRDKIKAAVDLLRKTDRIIICWAMGLTQHENGVANVQEVVNLLLLKGSIGKAGAGACPVRGHSNVQGDRTVGIWDSPKPETLDNLEKTFGFKPPRHPGFAVVEAIKAMHDGRAKVFIGMGGNFLSATPDTEYTAKALQHCRLTVHVSTKLNRSHLVHGATALILPCLGRTEIDVQSGGEQFVSVENSMGIVHSSQGVLNPSSAQLLSEPAIVAGMAKATLGARTRVDWDKMISNYDHIRDAIEQVFPDFKNYNERVRQPAGFYLPNDARGQSFATDTGKAKFTVNRPAMDVLPDGVYTMMTIRSHDQFNTTIYGLHDRYRGIYDERRVVMMNEKDMVEAGLTARDEVDITSEYGGQVRKAQRFLVVPYDIPPRCVATYFPEANVLVPIEHQAKGSKQPASKSVIVRIEKK